MKISNPHTIKPSQVKVNERLNLLSGNVSSSECVNVGYYDDTEIKRRLSILENEVSGIEASVDPTLAWRVARIEGNYVTKTEFNLLEQRTTNVEWRLQRIEGNYVTKEEFNSLEGRVTTLETIPVGLDSQTMEEILN